MTELILNELDEFTKRILDYYNSKNPITEKIESLFMNFLIRNIII